MSKCTINLPTTPRTTKGPVATTLFTNWVKSRGLDLSTMSKAKMRDMFGDDKHWYVIDVQRDGYCGMYAISIGHLIIKYDVSDETPKRDITLHPTQAGLIENIINGMKNYINTRNRIIKDLFKYCPTIDEGFKQTIRELEYGGEDEYAASFDSLIDALLSISSNRAITRMLLKMLSTMKLHIRAFQKNKLIEFDMINDFTVTGETLTFNESKRKFLQTMVRADMSVDVSILSFLAYHYKHHFIAFFDSIDKENAIMTSSVFYIDYTIEATATNISDHIMTNCSLFLQERVQNTSLLFNNGHYFVFYNKDKSLRERLIRGLITRKGKKVDGQDMWGPWYSVFSERVLFDDSQIHYNFGEYNRADHDSSDIGRPGPSDIGRPGTSDIGRPGPSGVVKPGTSDIGKPGSSGFDKSGTSDISRPGSSGLGKPGALDPSDIIPLTLSDLRTFQMSEDDYDIEQDDDARAEESLRLILTNYDISTDAYEETMGDLMTWYNDLDKIFNDYSYVNMTQELGNGLRQALVKWKEVGDPIMGIISYFPPGVNLVNLKQRLLGWKATPGETQKSLRLILTNYGINSYAHEETMGYLMNWYNDLDKIFNDNRVVNMTQAMRNGLRQALVEWKEADDPIMKIISIFPPEINFDDLKLRLLRWKATHGELEEAELKLQTSEFEELQFEELQRLLLEELLLEEYQKEYQAGGKQKSKRIRKKTRSRLIHRKPSKQTKRRKSKQTKRK